MGTVLTTAKATSRLFNGDVIRMYVAHGMGLTAVHFVVVDIFDEEWYYSAAVLDSGEVQDLVPIACYEDVLSRLDGDETEWLLGTKWEEGGPVVIARRTGVPFAEGEGELVAKLFT